MISVAFITLLERKVLGIVGSRLGPLKVYILGLIQPVSDAVKLSTKQDNYLSNSINFIFFLVGGIFIFFSLMIWTRGVYFSKIFNYKIDLLIILFFLSFNTLMLLLIGWVSFSKFSIIGSIRSATQAISYESLIIITFLFFCLVSGSFRIDQHFDHMGLLFYSPVLMIFWIFSILAEIGRTPYDFSEGERELVRGFNTEFGSKNFSFIFLSEYSNIIFMSVLTSVIFFSYVRIFVSLFVVFFFIWVRSVLPRSRFDFLIMMAWKFLIPFYTVVLIVYIVSVRVFVFGVFFGTLDFDSKRFKQLIFKKKMQDLKINCKFV